MFRLRRLRQHPALRDLLCETRINISDLVLPLFIKAGKQQKQAIASMPGHFQLSPDNLVEEVQEIAALGIPAVLLFGIPEQKDSMGREAYQTDGVIPQAIEVIKKVAPDLLVMTDVCLCEYTDHGHCGVVKQKGQGWEVDNDKTVELLAQIAISHAQAGADVVAPSSMMDGMVLAIRRGLDAAGFYSVPILSYSAKYASALYAPFREAAECKPHFGDRRSYQMDISNARDALREVAIDIDEGADVMMVKPAGAYLDVISRIKQKYPEIPLAAYQVSGEFSMIKAAAAKQWLDERLVALESLIAIKRAGADFIVTYFAKDVARWL
jgi:porphobilinogen synthase